MIPKDVSRRLGAEFNDACEVYGAALVHIQIGSAQNRSCGHCKERVDRQQEHEKIALKMSLSIASEST